MAEPIHETFYLFSTSFTIEVDNAAYGGGGGHHGFHSPSKKRTTREENSIILDFVRIVCVRL